MNLKLRLERLCDSKAWARLHFADGTSLIGRLLRLGHDYVEIETYGESDKPEARDYAKHLVPLALLKYITFDSSAFADAERRRLQYLSQLDSSQETVPEIEI
jgi:hypothetical protein